MRFHTAIITVGSTLMNYLIDCVLEKNPDMVIVCGGDFNQLNVCEFETLRETMT